MHSGNMVYLVPVAGEVFDPLSSDSATIESASVIAAGLIGVPLTRGGGARPLTHCRPEDEQHLNIWLSSHDVRFTERRSHRLKSIYTDLYGLVS